MTSWEPAALLKLVPTPRRLLADRAYDARKLRHWLAERGSEPIIPPNPTRKNPHAYDALAYRSRNAIERLQAQGLQTRSNPL
jgi:transposase